MKKYILFFILIICLLNTYSVKAQSEESIWITTSSNNLKTGESVIVTVFARSATPSYGFTFQIGYDPDCLQPVEISSTVPTMTYQYTPQTSGLVDASFYTDSTPQIVNGVLANVSFITLGKCETKIYLYSAALAIKDKNGFHTPLSGMSIDTNGIEIVISSKKGTSQELPLLGTSIPLGTKPDVNKPPAFTSIFIVAICVIGVMLLVTIIGVRRILLRRSNR
jgi:hypothetical protein